MNEKNFDHILLFKTNIKTKRDIKKIAPILTVQKEIIKWNVDLHDNDRVLRIISTGIKNEQIVDLLQSIGYACSELE